MSRLLFELFLLKISGVVNLIVICNEDSIHVFHLTDHFHAFVVAQQEAGSAESIGRQRGICNDGNTGQRIFAWIAGSWIQNVVIQFPVCFEVALVCTGSYDRFVGNLHGSNRVSKARILPPKLMKACLTPCFSR